MYEVALQGGHELRLGAGCVVQDRVECGVVDCAEEGQRRSVGSDDDDGGLDGYLEAEVDVAGIVADCRER